MNHFLYYFVSSICCGSSVHLAVDHFLYYFVNNICCGSSVHLAVDHFLYYFVNNRSGGREFTWRLISDLYYFFYYFAFCTICRAVFVVVECSSGGGSAALWRRIFNVSLSLAAQKTVRNEVLNI